ncbi:MAG TPA: Phenylacetic acid catabolic protein [Longimicrobiales bacterium]|nr:Phenylacetic acid catabolic protein [Longimicrobiales bacterium]
MRDLILILADSKRMLGTRYAEWILGAPELEAGIACASMAQDEWGHGRLLYALLKDFGDDVEQLEHGREPGEYRSMEVLDQEPGSWTEVVVLNALVDTALTIQLEALRETEHAPLRQRIGKLLDEEVFHSQHGTAWLKRLAAGSPEAKREIADAIGAVLPQLVRWFGPGAEGNILRESFLHRISSLMSATGQTAPNPSFDEFDPVTRRTRGQQPDERTIRRVRGDKNRQFLMD